MLNKVKILLSVLIILVSITSCKAADKEIQSEAAPIALTQSDSLQTSEYKPGEWITDYKLAMATAKENKLPVLINFTGSDWCIWCKRLSKEVFTEQVFIDYAMKSVVLLKLDFPKNLPQTKEEKAQNEALAQQFGIEGFPTIVILNPEGKEIARTQYREGGAVKYVEHLKSLIK